MTQKKIDKLKEIQNAFFYVVKLVAGDGRFARSAQDRLILEG